MFFVVVGNNKSTISPFLLKKIQDFIEGRGEKTVYLSLPRPGKHGTTPKGILRLSLFVSQLYHLVGFKPTKLDSDEQAQNCQSWSGDEINHFRNG